MIDATSYALSLFNQAQPSEYKDIIISMDLMATLVQQKGKVLKVLTFNELEASIKEVISCPQSLLKLLQIMIENRDLNLLPRISVSFRRQLEQNNIPVIEVVTAKPLSNDQGIKDKFGANSVIINYLDPDLIAGMRLTTPKGTYEYSLDLQLNRLKQTLV